ncbi:MAG: toprim domain-containing protein, partial [Candidatus Xenobia bacterium]
QAHLLRRYASRCTLAYDADNAGQKAAERGIGIFEAAGLTVRVMVMPPGEDPDTLARKEGADGVRKYLAKAPSVVDYLARAIASRLPIKTPEGKSDFVRQIAPVLARLTDDTRRGEYIARYTHRLGIHEDVLRRAVRSASAGVAPPLPARIISPTVGLEEELLACLLVRDDGVERVRQAIDPADFTSDEYRSIYVALMDTSRPAEGYTAATLSVLGLDEGKLSKLTEILLRTHDTPMTAMLLEQLVGRMQKRRLDLRLKAVQAEIKRKADSGALEADDPLLAEQMVLAKQLKGIR